MQRIPMLVVFSVVGVLSSCSGTVYDDGGKCPETRQTVITGLQHGMLRSQSDIPSESDLVRYDNIENGQILQADRLMIAVVANAQFAASQIRPASTLLAFIGNLLVPYAHALTCLPPQFVSQQPLRNINITSDSALSGAYPAGSNLSGVFRIGNQTSYSHQFGLPTGSIVARIPENRETIAEFLSAQPVVPLVLAMTLDVEDAFVSQHVFTITYSLDDNIVYTTQTDPVSITSQ